MNPTFFASYDSTLRRRIPYWAFVNAKIQHFNTGLLIFYRCDDCGKIMYLIISIQDYQSPMGVMIMYLIITLLCGYNAFRAYRPCLCYVARYNNSSST